jgi:thiamine-monophosphate kinase
MGAQPRWALLAAALPAATESWIAAFAEGFFACADAFGIDVVGGDTTKGPRNFCVTIFGEVPAGQALLRSGARLGDDVWVSGQPGRAALGLAHLQERCRLTEPALADCLAALHRPQPRLALGLALRGLASAAIDVSDGLLADLGHILTASGVAATLDFAALPDAALRCGADPELARGCLLAGGDDYELVFTAPAASRTAIGALPHAVSRIGSIGAGAAGTLTLRDSAGQPMDIAYRGFDHFG